MSEDRFKLRAWDKKLLSMFDDFAITAHNGQIYVGGINVTQHYVIMQSTGRKDKNDVLIFEGDWVKAFYKDIDSVFDVNTKEIKGQVKFLDDLSAWAIWIDDSNWEFIYALDNGIEKIGTVHEDPELLEVS